MTAGERLPIRTRAGQAASRLRARTAALLTGDGRPDAPGSVLLPKSLSLQRALREETQGGHPIVLAVGPNNGLLRDTVAAMVGKGKPFSDMYPTDSSAALMAFRSLVARKTVVGMIAVDVTGYGDWTELARAVHSETPGARIVLFGDVPRRQRREFGVNRVVGKPKESS